MCLSLKIDLFTVSNICLSLRVYEISMTKIRFISLYGSVNWVTTHLEAQCLVFCKFVRNSKFLRFPVKFIFHAKIIVLLYDIKLVIVDCRNICHSKVYIIVDS